ncbi:type I addiction module toxin, SymE family [Erwinia sp. 198]|nr:type I addiction module toxin, SymE family [Erwinia sp. 198]
MLLIADLFHLSITAWQSPPELRQSDSSLSKLSDWLEEAGFTIDTPVEVRVLPGCLIVTAKEPQPETAEPKVVVALHKACKKLSARKQRQIAEFIQVIATPQKRPRRLLEGTVEWLPL